MENGHTLSLTVKLPVDVDLDEQALKEYLAAKLFGDGKLALFEAANMVGIPKWDFPTVLRKFDVPYFNLTPEELHEDICNARPRNL